MPSQLGRYRILKHLATGGMAEVFLATSTGIEGFQRHVVIKRIHTAQAKNDQFVQMFLDEARLAAALHHHNIVQVHDIGHENDEYFYAMEYVHGEDLRALLRQVAQRKEKVPFEHVISIVIGAAAGLHYAHEHRGPDKKPLGIVHRDVSPSNVIVDFDGNVKVVDFGIAKAAHRSTETKSGVLKGKVAYMSPEQCRGKGVDRRSDVYALGIVLYELTTARRLFKGDNDFMTMSAIVAGKIPPPSSRRPDLPPELEGIIMAALAKDPAERYQSAHELRLALEQFAAAAGLRTSSTALASYMKQLFGEKPEPWLVDEYVPPDDLTIDFDGMASGVAAVSDSSIEDFANSNSSAPKSSPLVRARAKALRKGQLDDDDHDEHEGERQSQRSPTNASGTPMAWTAPQSTSVNNQRSPWVMTLVASSLVAVGVGLITLRPWESREAPVLVSPAAQPSTIEQPTPVEPARPAVTPPVIVAPAKPAQPSVVDPATPPVNVATHKPPKAKRKPDKKPPAASTGSGSAWDPDTLLPD